VEDLRQEVALRRLLRKVTVNHKLAPENTTREWCVVCSKKQNDKTTTEVQMI
jgi:hypothetical protein